MKWWNEEEPVYSDNFIVHFGFDNPDDRRVLEWAWGHATEANTQEILKIVEKYRDKIRLMDYHNRLFLEMIEEIKSNG